MSGVTGKSLLGGIAFYIGTVVKDFATTPWQTLSSNANLLTNSVSSYLQTTVNSTINATSSVFQNATEALKNTTSSAFQSFTNPEDINQSIRDTLDADPANGVGSGSYLGRAWSLLSGAASWTYWGWNLLPDSAKLLLGISLFFFILSRRTSVNVENHTHVHFPTIPPTSTPTAPTAFTTLQPSSQLVEQAAAFAAFSHQLQQQQRFQMPVSQVRDFPQMQQPLQVDPSQLKQAADFLAHSESVVDGKIKIPDYNIDMTKQEFLTLINQIFVQIKAHPNTDLIVAFSSEI